MKYKVEYLEITSDHIFASPDTVVLTEFIETKNKTSLTAYITKDGAYKVSEDKFMGFDYTSNRGAVRVEKYVEPKFKKV